MENAFPAYLKTDRIAKYAAIAFGALGAAFAVLAVLAAMGGIGMAMSTGYMRGLQIDWTINLAVLSMIAFLSTRVARCGLSDSPFYLKASATYRTSTIVCAAGCALSLALQLAADAISSMSSFPYSFPYVTIALGAVMLILHIAFRRCLSLQEEIESIV